MKAIVDQHLGEITFETAEGKGTTFMVDFPALNFSETVVPSEGLPE